MNVVVSLQSGKKIDTHVGEQNVNKSPFPSSSLPSPQSDDVCLFPMIPKDVDDPKESGLIHDSTSPKDSPMPSCSVATLPPSFPNWLKGKKVQSYIDKITETFS